MCAYDWIGIAKQHFIDCGGKPYQDGDEASKQSKEIKSQLRDFIATKLENHPQVVLNLMGSKWCVQGQRILTEGIWYRAYHKDFGPNYHVVLGVYLGSDGLNIAIQIYNKLLPDSSLLEMLGGFIRAAVADKGLDEHQRNNDEEPYSDFGFFDVSAEDLDDKFETVLNLYQGLPEQINAAIFEKMIGLYQTAPSSLHCKIDNQEAHYIESTGVRGLVDTFINANNNPDDELEAFKSFWNRRIMSSAQQAASAGNVIPRNNGIAELQNKIRNLVSLDNDNGDLVQNIKDCIESSSYASLELYYLYHMQDDNFPLINGCSKDAMKIIKDNKIELGGRDGLLAGMGSLKDRMRADLVLPQYYLLDQFLNLLHKIKRQDIQGAGDSQELYKLAYLFAFFRKVNKVNNADFFDNLLKKSKNIILYGAPGTGKTFTSENNIRRIIEDDYPNEDIDPDERFKLVQFHPSYSYEDFMEGLKPEMNNGHVELQLKDGDFMLFCKYASEYAYQFNNATEKEKLKYAFFFLIDEINRAELSRVFGELMYALDKRGHGIDTQYSYLKKEDKNFSIPENVYLIGTMNDVDRSIDSFDLALRRRFLWHHMGCDYSVIQSELYPLAGLGELNDRGTPETGYLQACYELNKFITQGDNNNLGLGKLYELGHSYFMAIRDHISGNNNEIKNKNLKDLFEYSMSPLLKEYLRTLLDENQVENQLAAAKKKFKLPAQEQ